ncbi:MAG: GAF domain-containing protein [Chloroflexi bacterium]|nr:GAF domain-containing protein [Chloroflexota bacterium]
MATAATVDQTAGDTAAKPAASMAYRLSFSLTLAICAFSVLMLAEYLFLALNWSISPFFGATLTHTQVVAGGVPSGVESWPGLDAGLERGDHVLAVRYCPPGRECVTSAVCTEDDCAVADWSANPSDYTAARRQLDYFMDGRRLGDSIQVVFTRAADSSADPLETCAPGAEPATLDCTVRYRLGRFSNSDFLAYFLVPYVAAIIIVVTGLLVLRLRYQRPVALLATSTFMLLAVTVAGATDMGFTHQMGVFWLICTVLAGSGLATIGMVFPMQMVLLYRQPRIVFLPLVIGVVLAAFIVYLYLVPGSPFNSTLSWQGAFVCLLLGMALLTHSAYRQRRMAPTNVIRDQSNIIFIGFVLMVAPATVWVLTRVIQALLPETRFMLPFSSETALIFAVIPVLSLAYAVLQYRKIDSDQIISKGITYGIMFTALVVGYFLLVLGASLLTARVVQAADPLLVAVTIGLVSIGFLPVRQFLQNRIDEIYFRKHRGFQQQLGDFSKKLTQMVDLRAITQEFQTTVNTALSPGSIFIFLPDEGGKEFSAYGEQSGTDLRFAADSASMQYLYRSGEALLLSDGRPWPEALRSERPRLQLLKVSMLAALAGQEQLHGFVTIGAPRGDRQPYAFEELQFFSAMTGQMAVAVERTQVIGSLRRRVRELDVLSQVSQAVNFTIEFDALLELISNQTSKLIAAQCFYIVLRDQVADQLYFAFFVEDDERYRDKENKRWPMTRGLYSEVIRSGKALRVEDYGQEMARRDTPITLMNPEVKAWMGVPLIAGPRTLGVLAMGTTEAGKEFSEDQLRIFGDIGTLAATSIDKARLFAETEIRARQLAVLNDISNRLVSSELNVEKLLEIITSSAVDILNAEAGSLFLVADDGSGDLEFKVVIGGSGKELLGSRVPAGRGLVGEVAKKGKPAIVNDTRTDNRFVGDLSKTFRTSSILAVPLIAKNQVIGVLEVLNRKDGGAYTDEDTALLSTFAGQAAVAIENARLFEVTDIQLGKRIAELEALERIDVELNRTLDLRKVAEIALRWAIAQTGAAAGVIGQVVGEPAVLQVLAMYGYRESDYPEGADGKIWPLEKGIVSRVMRTRQADLASDTAIDPDYTPSLVGSRSQITVPMMSGHEITAMLILESDRKDQRLSLLDLQFAQRLAEHASVAMENARLTSELNRTLESKSEFMGFAAHELKNPLASVRGYADVLMSGMSGAVTDQQKSFLSVIRSNAQRMETIINDLRDAAKVEAKQLKVELAPISYRNVVVETLRPFHKQLEDKMQEVIVEVSEDLPMILGDQTRLIQVVTNLVSNAHKYSPPESTITLNARVIQGDDEILQERNKTRKQKVKYHGPYLYCTIADTGIGMSDDDLRKIFRERYFRSEDQRAKDQPGTGLGMMITQNIIQLHHGEIWVTSVLDIGTTFHFIVPLAPQTQTEPASD